MMKQKQVAVMSAALLFVAVTTANAQPTVNVTIPGSATGSFGTPTKDSLPFVPALSVDGPGTITVTYLSGLVTDCCPDFSTGPNGVIFDIGNTQSPLQEAIGVAGGTVLYTDALIGVFAERSRVLTPGFSPIDGTKNLTVVGLLPGHLFFVGTGKTFRAPTAGTLFLGINDNVAGDGGSFTVSVAFTPAN
jgi:hypothetical protein